ERLGPHYDDVVIFSYAGGAMSYVFTTRGSQAWQWVPAIYDSTDTHHSILTPGGSPDLLWSLISAYRERYPTARFDLIGHSLGGLIAWRYVVNHVLAEHGD